MPRDEFEDAVFLAEEELNAHIVAEAERLIPKEYLKQIVVTDVDLYPERGFTMVALQYQGRTWRGYAKRCTYGPVRDPHNDGIALSVALGAAIHRAGIPRRKGA